MTSQQRLQIFARKCRQACVGTRLLDNQRRRVRRTINSPGDHSEDLLRKLSLLLLCVAPLLVPSRANAAALTFTGMGLRDIVTIDANVGGTAVSGSYYAGEINWDWVAPIPDGLPASLVTYCVDIVHEVVSPQNVTISTTADPLFSSPATDAGGKAAWLLNQFAPTVSSGLAAAALQVAIWEVLYDNDHNLSTGSFTLVTTAAAYTGATRAMEIAAQADTYLAQLFSASAPNHEYYTSTATWLDATLATGGGQDQITTPEPGSFALLALAGVIVGLRRRTSAAAAPSL